MEIAVGVSAPGFLDDHVFMCALGPNFVCLRTNVFVLDLDRGRFSQSWSDPTHCLSSGREDSERL